MELDGCGEPHAHPALPHTAGAAQPCSVSISLSLSSETVGSFPEHSVQPAVQVHFCQENSFCLSSNWSLIKALSCALWFLNRSHGNTRERSRHLLQCHRKCAIGQLMQKGTVFTYSVQLYCLRTFVLASTGILFPLLYIFLQT